LTSWLRIGEAARVVRAGGLVAYPTEAVYGLGCLPESSAAVARLLEIKGRSLTKGFIVIAATLEQLAPLAEIPGPPRREEIVASWPGPVTWTLPARADTPAWLTGGRSTIAVRVTAHPMARALCVRVGAALISTSANRSGRPPLRHALAVRRQFGRQIDFVVAGPVGPRARPTEIRDGLTGRILRAG
jgi:L-threonylcarbamoyladenylate synthase